jgi:large subunit ribosomal protein L30
MAKIQIKQIRSTIKKPENQKRTIQALGLGKINRVVEKEATPQILGMVRTVAHLIEVTEL